MSAECRSWRAGLLALALASCLLALPARGGSDDTDSATAASRCATFDRITVIGASASAGFGVVAKQVENGKPQAVAVDMADILVAASENAAHRPLINSYATTWLFFNPPVVGRGEIERALTTKPTAIIAIDFLFWHAYGLLDKESEPITDEEERMQLLELGLSRLDQLVQLGVPLVVGDLPDMHEAVGKMISATQVPSPEMLAKLNERIIGWASAKSNVSVLPLHEWLQALRDGTDVKLHDQVWNTSKWGPLLQRDRLHPTLAGTVALLAGAIEAIREQVGAPSAPFQFDPTTVEAALCKKLMAPAKTP